MGGGPDGHSGRSSSVLGAAGNGCPLTLEAGLSQVDGASVRGAMDLLAGGDHLAVLDFLHDGTHLAAGHRGYGRRRREAQGTSGWRPSPSLPQRRVLSLSPPALGRTGQAFTFPGGLRDQGRGVLGGQAAGKGGPVSPVVLVESPAPWEEKQLGRPPAEGREVPANRTEITAGNIQERMAITGSKGTGPVGRSKERGYPNRRPRGTLRPTRDLQGEAEQVVSPDPEGPNK